MSDTTPAPKRQRRSGAGVKPKDDARDLERKQILIDPFTEDVLTTIGNGNLSLGIREAARRLVAHKDVDRFSKKS